MKTVNLIAQDGEDITEKLTEIANGNDNEGTIIKLPAGKFAISLLHLPQNIIIQGSHTEITVAANKDLEP